MRQEIDGPQVEQLECVPSKQILQDEDNSKWITSAAKSCPDKREYISFSRSKTFLTTYVQKGSLKVKNKSDVNLPRGLFT